MEKPSQEPYISPPPIGYPTRDAAGGDPVVAAVETKSKGDDEFSYRRWYINISFNFDPKKKYFFQFTFFIPT